MAQGPPAKPIEIRVATIEQFFQTLDPFPFGEKDIDKEAEEYIVSWARELPRDTPITIVIHLPPTEAAKEGWNDLVTAFSRYFEGRADAVSRDINELFRIGRRSLAIGAGILALCFVFARASVDLLGSGTLQGLARESFLILGWVANWRPLEIFLYEWWPLARTRNLYRRLAAATLTRAPSPD